MNKITVKDGTEIYYKDWGTGQPLVFHHGWLLSSDDWDSQLMFFLNKGTGSLPPTAVGTAARHRQPSATTWIPTRPTSKS